MKLIILKISKGFNTMLEIRRYCQNSVVEILIVQLFPRNRLEMSRARALQKWSDVILQREIFYDMSHNVRKIFLV